MLDFFKRRSSGLKDEILSGLTVALALVPEAVAFAIIAGIHPLHGLYAACTVGLITSIFGGRPGMISGATGALAVVIIALVAVHGVEYLFPAVILMGLIQIVVGLLKLGKFIRLVPYSVMLGFVNGLAIVIFMAQLSSFREPVRDEAGNVVSLDGAWLTGDSLAVMLGLVALTMAIIVLLPKVTKAIPPSLAAIVTVSLLAIFGLPMLGFDTLTVGSIAGSIQAGMPWEWFAILHGDMTWARLFSFETLWIILPYSLILAAVGLIESLMTLSLIDEITDTRGQGNRECVGQGIANTVTGMFSGMGGCAMIGQSLINVNSGARRRASGIAAALFLLAFILFLSPLIEMIPMAALVGVMFMVVIGTFEWASLRMFRKVPMSDLLVMVTVIVVTVFLHNLALAVLIGVIIAALVFAWKHATHLAADSHFNEYGAKIYQLHGPLFFASTDSFRDLFDPANDPEDVVIDFYYTRVYDQSGLEAINSLAERYGKVGKRLHLRHLSPECRDLLDRARDLVEVNLSEDPQYHVSTDRLE
ncbi:SulP family inorganic anion transporter [Phycisphaerales bacterium AB-hyl4]|uniref:SulP family inorganic anion transporter n=1 Tax=Natronomicrosphaera hydrolytica TaxID=3242702 RepID=A0ABV4U4K9_9BACT